MPLLGAETGQGDLLHVGSYLFQFVFGQISYGEFDWPLQITNIDECIHIITQVNHQRQLLPIVLLHCETQGQMFPFLRTDLTESADIVEQFLVNHIFSYPFYFLFVKGIYRHRKIEI